MGSRFSYSIVNYMWALSVLMAQHSEGYYIEQTSFMTLKQDILQRSCKVQYRAFCPSVGFNVIMYCIVETALKNQNLNLILANEGAHRSQSSSVSLLSSFLHPQLSQFSGLFVSLMTSQWERLLSPTSINVDFYE